MNKTRTKGPARKGTLNKFIKVGGVGNAASTKLGVVTPQGVKAHAYAPK